MAHTVRWIAAVTLSLAAAGLSPQTLLSQPAAAHITLGQSSVPLYGPWKFAVGDSPIDAKTGQPLWAEPGFDDSKWETVDLTPRTGSDVDPVTGATGYVPGWTARGHAGYSGYAWYRIRVNIDARPGQALALAGPANVDDIYQVFANGGLVGQFGGFKSNPPTEYYSHPMMFALPFSLPGQSDSSTGSRNEATSDSRSAQVLAFRVLMFPTTLTLTADVGGFHTAPMLGDAGTVAASYQLSWLDETRGFAIFASEVPIFGLIAVLAFTMILFDRSDQVYLWIGSLFLLQAVSYASSGLSYWTQYLSTLQDQLFNNGLVTALTFAGWVMVWWVWFGRQRPAWTPRAAAGLAALFLVTTVLGQEMFAGLIPHPVAAVFLMASVLVRLLFLVLQLWIVFQGIRRYGLEGWMVMPAVVLWGIGSFQTEFLILHIPERWSLFGFSIRLNQISDLLLVLVVALLLLRRLLKSLQLQRQMALDVKQAQEVQQVILPESVIAASGLSIESEYRPAREVGGDFFQVIPNPTDDSVLIVAGDVTGKGLKAGMLVALLIGAIRTTAEERSDPAEILAVLNRRLLGRGDSYATCLAMRIERDGSVTLANAGHLPPYLNGTPLEIEGSLPLGMVETLDLTVLNFDLAENDWLLMVSDGVAEATNHAGELFSFDRLQELLRTHPSATEIADAAQAFGQDDDISVLSVRKVPVAEPAMA